MICTECRSDLYCIDSRYIRENKVKGRNLNSKCQLKQRYYSCPNKECNSRYVSMEVLNPMPYSHKIMPKSKRKIILGENDEDK